MGATFKRVVPENVFKEVTFEQRREQSKGEKPSRYVRAFLAEGRVSAKSPEMRCHWWILGRGVT